MSEQRRYERMPFFCPVTVSVLPDGPALSARTLDISLGGVGIITQGMLERGTTVRVRFHFRIGSGAVVDEDVMGQVAYSRADEGADRVGIAFLQTVDESLQPMLAHKLDNLS